MCRLHAGQRGRSLDSACMHARVPTRPFNRWLRDLQSLTHAHRPGAREGVEAAGAVGPEVCQAFCQRGAVKNCSSLTPENAAVPYILRLSLLRQSSQMSSPSLVPETSGAVHMVLDDFGKLGREKWTNKRPPSAMSSMKSFTAHTIGRSGSSPL